MNDSQIVAVSIPVLAVLVGSIFNNLRISDLSAKIDTRVNDMRDVLRSEMKLQQGELRAELKEQQAEMKLQQGELRAELKEQQAETKAQQSALRAEIKQQQADTKLQLSELRLELNTRFDRVECQLEMLIGMMGQHETRITAVEARQ